MLFKTAKTTFALLTVLSIGVAILGTSCKKDDEKTTKDYLAAHDWKVTEREQANVSIIQDCEKDDIYTFHKDGEFHFDQGATKCFETDLQQLPGTWSLSTSTTPETLTITFDSGLRTAIEGKISELSDDRFVVTREYSVAGITIKDEYIFETN